MFYALAPSGARCQHVALFAAALCEGSGKLQNIKAPPSVSPVVARHFCFCGSAPARDIYAREMTPETVFQYRFYYSRHCFAALIVRQWRMRGTAM